LAILHNEAGDMDFYNLIVQKFGPETSFLKLDRAGFQSIQDDFEKARITYAIRRARGNQALAAQIFGCNRLTFKRLMVKHGVNGEDAKALAENSAIQARTPYA